MAGFRETIHLLIDIDGSGATTSVGRLKTELSNTDGAFNKMRVGAAGAFDMVKQHAAAAGIAAATAIAAFAVKAVGEFQNVALGAGHLRDALGLTAEEASRLQEVAGDLEIPLGAIEKTIGRMNREAANAPEKFDEIGAAIVRNQDGTINVNETFLATIDALNKIPDASRRAAAAQDIFGRSWQDISELVATGADGVRAALASVEDAKIIDDAEIEKARRLRDAMDQLKGVVESATLVIGEGLVDALADVEDVVRDLQGPFDALTTVMREVGDLPFGDQLLAIATPAGVLRDQLDRLTTATDFLGITTEEVDATFVENAASAEYLGGKLDETGLSTDELAESTAAADEAARLAAEAMDALAAAAQRTKDRARELDQAWSDLKAEVDDDQAFIDLQDTFANLETAFLDSYGAAEQGATDAEQRARDYDSAVNTAKQSVIEFGQEVLGLPPTHVSTLLARIDEGKFAEVENRLAILARNRTMNISIQATGGIGYGALTGAGSNYATGGRVGAAGGVGGEAGLEDVEINGQHALIAQPTLLPPGAFVTPLGSGGAAGGSSVSGAAGGGSPIVVNVTAPYGVNADDWARQVAEGLERHLRTTGGGSLRRKLGAA